MSTVIENDLPCQPDTSENPPGILSPVGGLIVYRANVRDGCQAAHRPMLRAYNPDQRQVVYFQPLCKSWTCPYCAPRRATAWQIRAIEGVNVLRASKHIDFVTVTSHERLDAAASLAVLPEAWHKLYRRLRRASGEVEYFAVPEQHKNGRWHLHAIVAAEKSLKKKWWKDHSRACGLGYQSDVQEVKTAGGVGGYVSKYLTKMLQVSNLPKGFKRVRPSHGWPKQTAPENQGWTFSIMPRELPLNSEVERYQEIGFTVVLADGTSSWDWIGTWADAAQLGD